jgi:hypothetical protein
MALILKRASAGRPSGEWNDDDFDVLADCAVVGRIIKAAAAPVGTPWLLTLAFWHHEDRTPTHGYEATREAAMAAFRKSWQRESQEPAFFARIVLVMIGRPAVVASPGPSLAAAGRGAPARYLSNFRF